MQGQDGLTPPRDAVEMHAVADAVAGRLPRHLKCCLTTANKPTLVSRGQILMCLNLDLAAGGRSNGRFLEEKSTLRLPNDRICTHRGKCLPKSCLLVSDSFEKYHAYLQRMVGNERSE